MKFLITGIDTRWNGERLVFDGFKLKDEVGSACPFVGGEYKGDAPDPDSDPATYPARELEWAKQQVGKYLECEELLYRLFATRGNTRIVEPPLPQAGN